jgi:hypothetical protein
LTENLERASEFRFAALERKINQLGRRRCIIIHTITIILGLFGGIREDRRDLSRVLFDEHDLLLYSTVTGDVLVYCILC